MLVNARPVAGKVGVDGEGRLDGPVLHDLGHDLGLARVNTVGVGAVVQVLVVGDLVAVIGTRVGIALRGRSLRFTAWLLGAVHVMVTGLDLVGLAALLLKYPTNEVVEILVLVLSLYNFKIIYFLKFEMNNYYFSVTLCNFIRYTML